MSSTRRPARYGAALMAASNAIPILIPPEGDAMHALLDRLDGIMFNGSPSNVAPMRYGADFDATPDLHDAERDATTLPMIRAALDRGMPIFGHLPRHAGTQRGPRRHAVSGSA